MKLARLKINNLPYATVIFALCLSSCKKDEVCDHPSLPCQTHEGKNTFGCLIDGVPFVAKTSFSIGGAVAVSGEFDESSNFLHVNGSREDSQGNLEDLRFKCYVTDGISEYTMDVNTENYMGYLNFSGSKCNYFHDPQDKGKVSITYHDSEKNIISGTFFMSLVNPDCNPTVMNITNGRFDFGY
jgi:hypothetical protein